MKDKLLAQEQQLRNRMRAPSQSDFRGEGGRSSLAAAGGSKSVGFAQVKLQKAKANHRFLCGAQNSVRAASKSNLHSEIPMSVSGIRNHYEALSLVRTNRGSRSLRRSVQNGAPALIG
jgi:hypothetical protein